jgi:creatinine amidohydrolase
MEQNLRLKSHYWWDLSTRDFAECDMGSVVAILPIGAVEQHGPHLPVRVDAAINAGIIERTVAMMGDDFPALVLPAMPIGKSNEHYAFKGTLGLSYETLARVWFEIGECVHRAGCRKIILFNSHGGQPQVMEIVTRELRVKLDMFAVSCSWFRMTDTSDLFDAKERQFGIHGGQAETSVMLHLHRDLVAMENAEDFVPKSVALAAHNDILTPEGAVGFGWQTQDLQAAGACGNASAAKAELGAEVVARAAQRFYALIEEVIRYPLADITQVTRYGRL